MPVGAEDLCDFFGACPAAVPNEQAWAKAAREVMRNPAVRQCAATGWWAGTPCVFVQNNLQVMVKVRAADGAVQDDDGRREGRRRSGLSDWRACGNKTGSILADGSA